MILRQRRFILVLSSVLIVILLCSGFLLLYNGADDDEAAVPVVQEPDYIPQITLHQFAAPGDVNITTRLRLLICIITAPNERDSRDMIRNNWLKWARGVVKMPTRPAEEHHKILTRFFIARTNDTELQVMSVCCDVIV